MKMIRWALGKIILIVEKLITPRPIQHDAEKQQKLNLEAKQYSLYQFQACPFCVKVRLKLARLNLNIELRDAKNNQKHREDLNNFGGQIKVPCLRIKNTNGEDHWLYESDEIIRFLEQRVTAA